MCFELTAIGESFAAFFALKRLLTTMAAFMALESCLSRERFSAYRATEVFIYHNV